jgi:purine-binding chemotaxis protein CheW
MNEQVEKDLVQTELKRRAIALAKIPVVKTSDEELMEVMPFALATETYALETRFIREVWPLSSYITIPKTPVFVVGVANVHGEICSIVDLKIFFSLPTGGITNLNKLIILELDGMTFGVLADDVFGTHSILKSDLSSADDWQGNDGSYLAGITKDRLVVLDAARILKDERLIVNEGVEL